MKTITEHIRYHLESARGLNRPEQKHSMAYISKEVSKLYADLDHVITLAKNRLFMGALRYGVGNSNNDRYNYGAEAKKRLDLYFTSGNTEYLVDCINFCNLEFHYPKVPGAKFDPQDDGVHSTEIT